MTETTYPSSVIGHFDIVAPGSKALHHFYTEVFGWKIEEQGPGYALVRTPSGSPDGAIGDADEPSLTVGVVVPDLAVATSAATAAGGELLMPATDNGWVVKAQITDPAGNRLTLIEGRRN